MKKQPELVGLYRKKGKQTWRFRWTDADGVRHGISTGKRELSEAIEVAKSLRGTTPSTAKKNAWAVAVDKYLADKVAGKRPPHLAGRRLQKMRKSSVYRVKSCLTVFAERTGVKKPEEATVKHLQKYYDTRSKNSEAGARSTIATVQAFLDHMGCLRERVKFDAGNKPEARMATISVEVANRWIDECHRDDLRFVLFCGLHCGMRKGEIRHSRPAWFDLQASPAVITIPGKEVQYIKTGRFDWKTKDGETRQIPLSKKFVEFLKVYLPTCTRFCLASKFSKDGLLDFRVPYEKFVAIRQRPDLTIHGMRHSWISSLCNSGHASITQIAAWSGDSIQTIQANYWHKNVAPEALDSTLEGKKAGHDATDIKAMIAQVQHEIYADREFEEWQARERAEMIKQGLDPDKDNPFHAP